MYGMFRTKDINLMTINKVYIGGIYGTLTIAHRKEEPYDSTQTCAYKRLLKSNIIALADNAKLLITNKTIISYDIITKYYFNYPTCRNE